ncbi:MAG: hypothetical protein KC506_03565 [Nanoarchaeota archaeon]|nr:hypothetical protein [Nanoarchaeota archaeon]
MKARTIIPLAIATVVTGAVGINKIVDSIGETNSLARDYAVVKANLTPREIQNYRFWSEATGQSILPHNGAANVF